MKASKVQTDLLRQNRFREDSQVRGDLGGTGLATFGFVMRQERQFRVAELTVRQVRPHRCRDFPREFFRPIGQ